MESYKILKRQKKSGRQETKNKDQKQNSINYGS